MKKSKRDRLTVDTAKSSFSYSRSKRRPFLKVSAGSAIAVACGVNLDYNLLAQDTSNPFDSCPVTAGVDLKGGAGALGVHDNDVCKQVNYITVVFDTAGAAAGAPAHNGRSGRVFEGTMTVHVDVCYCHSAGLCEHDLEAVSEETHDFSVRSGGFLAGAQWTTLNPGDDTTAPAGSYSVGNWFGTTGSIDGFPMDAGFTTHRSDLEIHFDSGSPGSQGCIVVANQGEWNTLKELMAYNRAADVSPDPCAHGFGGDPSMTVSYAAAITPVGNDHP